MVKADDIVAGKDSLYVSAATANDLSALVALHVSCLPPSAHIATALGADFLGAAYRWLLASTGAYVLVARLGGRMVGFTAVATWPYNSAMLRACYWEAAWGLAKHPLLLFNPELFSRPYKWFSGQTRGDLAGKTAQIAWTAVDPEYQGKGVGKALRHAAFQESGERGQTVLIVGMRKHNTAARHLNESVGFVEMPRLNTRCLTYFQRDLSGKPLAIVPLASAHLRDVVDIHRRAFSGFFLSGLGPGFLHEFYGAFVADLDALAFVSQDGAGRCHGLVVGSLRPQGFFRRLLARRWWALAMSSVAPLICRPKIAGRLLRGLFYRGESSRVSGRALLSSIAVDPLLQKAGVGKALLNHWVHQARSHGATGCLLTTDAEKNDAVNQFYRAQGWKLEAAYTTPEHRKMNRYVYDFEGGGRGES